MPVLRVQALRRIVTPVKGAVVEAGERGTLDGDNVRWDSMPFAAVPAAEDVDYTILAGPCVRVRALCAIGGADKGTIVHAGSLGWRDSIGIVWDACPRQTFRVLTEGRQYEVVADTQPAADPQTVVLTALARERILLEAAAGVKEHFDQCCALASSGNDFHEAWEAAMREQTKFLAELHRMKNLPH